MAGCSTTWSARSRHLVRIAVVAAVTAVVTTGVTLAPPAADAAPAAEPVIVRLEPGNDPVAAARAAAGRGARIRHVYRDVFPGYAAVLPPGGLRGVEGEPGVLAVDPDEPVRLRVAVAAPRSGSPSGSVPWGLDRIDQRALPLSGTWTPPAGRAGAGVSAYVIDSGIAAGHRDFGGRVRAGFTSIDDGRGTADCAGHGTHVAGTVGGEAYGVAPAVALVAVRTLDCDGAGDTSGVIAGMDWVARDHGTGPAVANLSLSGPANESVDAAVRGLVDDGVVVAVAAGNEDEDSCASSPAREPAALTVSATGPDDRRASFANRGSCVDLFAPGVDIVSAWHTGADATAQLSGTSMASPHVAGAAALLLGAEPQLTAAQVAQRLMKDATTGAVQGRRDTPDRLLYVGSAATDAPRSTPAPVIVSPGSATGTAVVVTVGAAAG